jgi:hypothetical protein
MGDKLTIILFMAGFVAFGQFSAQAADTRLRGTIISGGVTCPLMRAQDGKTVSLTGLPHEFRKPGTRVSLTGSFVQYSFCQQGSGTFAISRASAVSR